MPKQQIATDIAESEQDYQQQSSRLVHVSNTVITKTPVDVTDKDSKKSIIKYSDKPLTKEELRYIERRDDFVYAFNNFQEKCTRAIWSSGLNVDFDVWWFINGKTYKEAGVSYDVYREMRGDNFTIKGFNKIPRVFHSLLEFKIEDFKSKSEYTAVFLFDPQKTGKSAFEIRLNIVDGIPTTFVFQGTYIMLIIDPKTSAVDFSKEPITQLVEIHGRVDNRTSSAPLLLILEQPYF